MIVRRRYRLLFGLALTGGALWLLLRAVTSQPSVDLLVEELSVRLSKEFGLTLTVGNVDVAPEQAQVVLSPVLVRDADDEVLFSAQRIELSLLPLELFQKRLAVRSLVIEEPFLHVRLRKDGSIAGIRVPEGASPADDPLVKLDVHDFRVLRGSGRLSVEELGEVVFESVTSRLRGSGPDGHRLKFSVGQAAFTHNKGKVTTERFGGRIVVFGDGLLEPERVSISDITLRSEAGTVDVAGNVLIAAYDKLPAFDVTVHGSADFQRLLQPFDLPVGVEGQVAATVNVSAEQGAQALKAEGHADVEALQVDGYDVGTLRGAFVGDRDKIVFPRATWQVADALLRCQGTFHLDENITYQYEVSGADLSIYSLLDGLQIGGSWTDVRVDGDVVGDGQVLPEFLVRGHGRGHFHDLLVASRDARRARPGDVVLTNQRDIGVDAEFFADMSHLRLDGFIDDGWTRADGTVILHFSATEGLEIVADGAQGDFKSVGERVGSLPLTGAGGFRLEVGGPYADPWVQVDAVGKDIAVDGFPVADRGAALIGYRDGKMTLTDIDAQKGKSQFGGTLALDWFRKHDRYRIVDDEGHEIVPFVTESVPGLAVDADLVVTRGRAEDLRAMIPARFGDSGVLGFFRTLDVDGPVTAQVTTTGYIGDGTVDHLVGGGQVTVLPTARLLGQTLTGGQVDVRLTPDRIYVDPLRLEAAGGEWRFGGSIKRATGDTQGDYRVNEVALSGLDALQGAGTFTGQLLSEGRVTGDIANPVVDGRVQLRGAQYDDIPLRDAFLTLHHEDRVAHLHGPVLGRRGQGEFEIATTAPYAYSADIDVNRGPAVDLLPPDMIPQDLDVFTAGTLAASGALSTMSESRGTIQLATLEIDRPDLPVKNTADVLAHFRGDSLTIDQFELATPQRDALSLSGTLSTETLGLTVQSKGQLWFFTHFIDALTSARGGYDLQLSGTGTWDSPRWAGTATLTRATFNVADFHPTIRGVDANLRFQGRHVIVEQAVGKLGDAPFDLDGTVRLAGLSPDRYDLKMAFKDLKLKIPEWLPTRTSGTVTLTGPADFPTLGGEVELLQATYTEDINVDRMLPEFRRQLRRPLVFDKTEEDLRYDIHLVSPGGIVVHNNIADIEAKGDLYLVGTDERTGLKGNLSLLSGTAVFRNNTYRLTRGTVEFTDTYQVSPLLDIDAETRVRDYDITARLNGPLRDLRIDLSSQPELAEIDILALLTFGFTQLELQNTTVSAGAAGLEVVSAYTGLDQEVRRILPDAVRGNGVLTVDELRLTSQFSSRQQSNVPAVRVGFEVNPGFWGLDGSKLRLQSTLLDATGQGTDQSVEWEKRFDNDLRFRLTWRSQDRGACPQCTNQWGDVGADLRYRWEF